MNRKDLYIVVKKPDKNTIKNVINTIKSSDLSIAEHQSNKVNNKMVIHIHLDDVQTKEIKDVLGNIESDSLYFEIINIGDIPL